MNNIYAPEIKGSYSLDDALSILLAETGLRGKITAKGQIRITKDHGYYNSDFEPTIDEIGPGLEETIVTGLQYAWQSSSMIKQRSVVLNEVLSESDMNKLPDGNVADSLQRMSGLQIERRNGDGTKFRIRGFDKNVTLYNGETFLTGLEYFQLGLGEQGYENSIEVVPVELLRRIEVYKSLRASDIEGAIGGTVDLISRNAFDVVDYLATGDIKLDYGKFAKKKEPEIFLGLGRNWDDNFATLFTLNYSKRTMHMDLAQNYVDRGIEENVSTGIISTFVDGPTSFDYLSPKYTSISDIEQTRSQTGASFNVGWRPTSTAEIQFEWFGIYSQLNQRDYQILFGTGTDTSAELKFNTDHELAFLSAANYESGDQVFRTIGETFDTSANNFNLGAKIEFTERLSMNTQFAKSHSSFDENLGNADLLTLAQTRFLPYWIGEGIFSAPGVDDISSPTGWVRFDSICASCQDPSNNKFPIRYDNASQEFTSYRDRQAYLNKPEDTFGAFSQAKATRTQQNAWSLKSDFKYLLNDNEENNLAFGFRTNNRESVFKQYRYLTNLAKTQGASLPAQFDANGQLITPSSFSASTPSDENNIGIALPIFYDLCSNGGLFENQECDINGDSFNDNLPYGPWVYQLNPANQEDILGFQNSNFLNTDLYGQEFGFRAPGFLPWRSYSEFPEEYVTLTDFFPSGNLSSHNASFVKGERISSHVSDWISSIAPNSPTKRFEVPRNSWKVKQQTTAIYAEINYRTNTLPIIFNGGLRYVETKMDVARSVIKNGSGISLTPEEWYVSDIGEAWTIERTKNIYRQLLPASNLVWELSDKWQLRFAGSKTISLPSFSQLGKGDEAIYNLEAGFDDLGFYVFNRAAELSTGNPNLKPTVIKQGDVSLEYYGKGGTYVQFALFHKDIKGQVFNQNQLGPVPDESSEGRTEVLITRPEMSRGSHAKGLEVAMQYTWGSGLGSSLNYSYNDSPSNISSLTRSNLGLPGVSKNTLNWSGFFESYQIRLQLNYSWRDEFLAPYNSLNIVGFDSASRNLIELAQIYEAYGQWDARVLYFLNDSTTLSLDLLNLTQAKQSSYLEFKDNQDSHTVWEPRIIFGLKIDF